MFRLEFRQRQRHNLILRRLRSHKYFMDLRCSVHYTYLVWYLICGDGYTIYVRRFCLADINALGIDSIIPLLSQFSFIVTLRCQEECDDEQNLKQA